jgi:hypothetical protein
VGAGTWNPARSTKKGLEGEPSEERAISHGQSPNRPDVRSNSQISTTCVPVDMQLTSILAMRIISRHTIYEC